MAVVLMYNSGTNNMERYERALSEPMPYNIGNTLKVGEFRARSCSNILWSSKDAMEAWNITRRDFGSPIPVGYAFRRIWEGGHSNQSQHYAGLAFDVGQALTAPQRDYLRNVAIRTGMWGYVEPAYLTPTWVHFDRRFIHPACPTGGFPLIRWGSKNIYVCVLQDALNAIGFNTHGLDGIFGYNTQRAVRIFQSKTGLAADGVVGCQTWRALTGASVGIGQTSSTVWKCY